MKYVFDTAQVRRYQFPTHTNDLILDRADAQTSEVFLVVLEPGQAPPLHQHDDTEQIFFVLQGNGRLTIALPDQQAETFVVSTGNLVRIPPSTPHSIEANGESALHYLAIDCFVGGRPEAEPTWDSHVHVMCRQNNWNYNQVMQTDSAQATA